MSSRRGRMLALDQRTGRLERAVFLLEDGEIKGLRTREPDPKHPQSFPLKIGPDRATLRLPKTEKERSIFTFYVGFEGGSDLTRQSQPCAVVGPGGGTFSWHAETELLLQDLSNLLLQDGSFLLVGTDVAVLVGGY